MITSILAAVMLGGLLGLIVKLAAICIILWGVYAILQAFGVAMHPVVRIVFIVLISLVALYVLYEVLVTML